MQRPLHSFIVPTFPNLRKNKKKSKWHDNVNYTLDKEIRKILHSYTVSRIHFKQNESFAWCVCFHENSHRQANSDIGKKLEIAKSRWEPREGNSMLLHVARVMATAPPTLVRH